jgi:hypothetical protein
LLGLFAVLVVVMGCVDLGVKDFFESGFADDETDNDDTDNDDTDDDDTDDDNNNGDLTVETLAGEWSLDRDASTVVLIGTWDAPATVDANFLAGVLQSPEDIDQLEISETEFVFRDENDDEILPTFNFEIRDANQIRLISGTTSRDITFGLSSDGTGLTLTDGSSQVVFESAETRVIATYILQITAPNQFYTTLTFNNGNPETITETLSIVDDDTIQLTEGSNPPIEVQVTLSNNDDTLKLVFPTDDRHDRGTAVFDKQQ